MNRVRRTILKRLLSARELRYAQIKPKNIEGNLFTYHLRKLLDEELIAKNGDGFYSLSAKGKFYGDTLSLETFSLRIQPKIVTMLVIKNGKGEYLLYKRLREPYLGKVGFPYGKIHLGETILGAAERELEEKTGLSTELVHRGEVYIVAFQNGELITHILCHIFSGFIDSGAPKHQAKIARCFWKQVADPETDQFIPGFADIFKLVKKQDSRFFAEFVYNL